MSSANKNLSAFDTSNLPDISGKRFGLVVAAIKVNFGSWNSKVLEETPLPIIKFNFLCSKAG